MAKAAIKSHAPALYSLAVIQFNGSGGLKNAKDLRAGVALCARAAYLGHIDALRELGHCLQDGYGVRKSVAEGRRLLVQANARELACVIRASCKASSTSNMLTWQPGSQTQRNAVGKRDPGSSFGSALWSDFGCHVPTREVHPANRFLVEWFGSSRGEYGLGDWLRMCSHGSCGRAEIRRNEFRRCSGCGKVNYCSRGCQAHDWKMRHKVECAPMEQWMMMMDQEEEEEGVVEEDDDENDGGGDDHHTVEAVDEENEGDDDLTVEVE